jgi:hypothetical protein
VASNAATVNTTTQQGQAASQNTTTQQGQAAAAAAAANASAGQSSTSSSSGINDLLAQAQQTAAQKQTIQAQISAINQQLNAQGNALTTAQNAPRWSPSLYAAGVRQAAQDILDTKKSLNAYQYSLDLLNGMSQAAAKSKQDASDQSAQEKYNDHVSSI